MTDQPWPKQLRLSPDKTMLTVVFDDDACFELSAEYLRVLSPSAEVQGHTAAEKKTVPGKQKVKIIGVEPVGQYAAKLVFDDGHASGYYTWVYLHHLGDHHDDMWHDYLQELKDKGLSRIA